MSRGHYNTRDFTAALRSIERPGGRQLQFLQAHYLAPGHALTAAKLAKAARYKSWAGLNLQYGLIAKKVGEAMHAKDFHLGSLVDFAPPNSVTNKHWVLIMKPEFARALKQAGWVRA